MNNQRIVAAALCPTTQSTVSVLYQSGKLAFWQLSNGRLPLLYRSSFIEDVLEFNDNLSTKSIGELSLHQLSQMGSLSSGVTCVRMRPMDELTKVENDPFGMEKCLNFKRSNLRNFQNTQKLRQEIMFSITI